MTFGGDLSRRRLWLATALLAVVAFGMALIASGSYGIGVSPDSLNYLAAAESLAGGEGFRTADGEVMSTWPPLYPLALAAGPRLGLPTLVFARWLQAVLAGLVAATAGGLLIGRVRWWPLVVLAIAISIVAQPMVTVQSFAWSEPLFILLMLLAFWTLSEYLETGRRRWLAATAIAVALACLTRYSGVVLVPVTAASLLTLGPGGRWRRVTESGLATIVAAAPLSLWILRNAWLSASLAGPRPAATATVAQNFTQACRTFNSWLWPGGLGRLIEGSAGLTVGTALLLAAALAGLVVAGSRSGADADAAGKRRYACSVMPLALFVPAHVLWMLALASLTAIDRLGSRLLSPVCIPAVLLLALGVDELLYRARDPRLLARRRLWAAVGLATLLALCAEPGRKRLLHLAREGQGYTARVYREQTRLPDLVAQRLRVSAAPAVTSRPVWAATPGSTRPPGSSASSTAAR